MADKSESSMVKPISECFIKPKQQVEESKQPYYLTHLDLTFLPLHYLQKGLLFTKPPEFDIEPFLEKLKRSLSFGLVHFYPLAGRFTTVEYEDEGACWIYLDCNKGHGARFIHAACDSVTVNDVVASDQDVIPVIRSFFELGEKGVVNYHGHTRALLSIQVTELMDGLFIGFTMNHSVVDGKSFWHFVSSVSEIFKQMSVIDQNQENVTITRVPIYNRPISPERSDPIIKLPYPDFMEILIKENTLNLEEYMGLSERIFHFSSESIARLKAQANNIGGGGGGNQISSFQSLCGLIWRSIIRARNPQPETVTTFCVVADSRPRFDPPLSGDHFGTLIIPVVEGCKVGELLGNGLGWAGLLIHGLVERIGDREARGLGKATLEFLLGKPKKDSSSAIVGGESAVVMGGSVRFDLYGPGFGLGQAVAVRTGYSAKKDGKVTANPGREGGGSVDLEISLLPQVMNALEQDPEFMSFVS